jgi:hypothetical protein
MILLPLKLAMANEKFSKLRFKLDKQSFLTQRHASSPKNFFAKQRYLNPKPHVDDFH